MRREIVAALVGSLATTAAPVVQPYTPAATQLPAADSMRVTMRIGGRDGGGHILTAINFTRGAVVSARGFIFIAQSSDGNISVFDSTGRAIRKIGRRGAGPGEFSEVHAMGVVGDTLWAADFPSHRIHLFSLTGAHLATRTYNTATQTPNFEWDQAVGYTNGGSALMILLRSWPQAANSAAPQFYIMRLGQPPAGRADTIVRLDTVRSWRTPNRSGRTAQPFDDAPLWAVSPNGTEVIRIERRVAGAAPAAQLHVQRFSTATLQSRVQSVEVPRERISPQLIDSVVDRQASARVKMAQFPSMEAARSAFRPTLFVPAALPPVQRVVAGVDGSIWLQRAARDEWIVLDNNGRVARVVRLPAGTGTRVAAVAIDHAWLASETSDGEPQVIRYSVVPRGG